MKDEIANEVTEDDPLSTSYEALASKGFLTSTPEKAKTAILLGHVPEQLYVAVTLSEVMVEGAMAHHSSYPCVFPHVPVFLCDHDKPDASETETMFPFIALVVLPTSINISLDTEVVIAHEIVLPETEADVHPDPSVILASAGDDKNKRQKKIKKIFISLYEPVK